jgi:hypothetical protein
MRKLALIALASSACAPASYYYSFDLTNPGAQNLSKPGQRDTLEDDSVKSEILVDPTTFQAIALDVTNKTNQMMDVQWDQIRMTGPDGIAVQLQVDQPQGMVQPGRKVAVRLIPFALPATGSAAAGFDKTHFELDVPMVVNGQPKTYQFQMIVHMQKL